MTHLVQLLFERPGGAVWVSVVATSDEAPRRCAALLYRHMSDPESGPAQGVRIVTIAKLSANEREAALREVAANAAAVGQAIASRGD